MKRRTAATLTAIALLPLAACADLSTTTAELNYQIDQSVTAVVIDARAASVAIVAGDGPVTVTEEHRYSRSKPTTAHRVDGQTLRLTESGCGDDLRCDVDYRIRMPMATSAEITAQAGAVKVDGLSGDLHVATQAGAVEGRALTSAEVTIETAAGAASLEFVKAPTLVRARTHAGAVELRVPGTTAYAVDVRTAVGATSVDVDKNPASKHRIEIQTDVGAVKIERSS
jgi:DUF4097 and DUF4098 domain-containing protein YvlB